MTKSRRKRWTGHVSRMREMRNLYKILVGKPKGKIPLGRHTRKWEDNIKPIFGKQLKGVDWFHVA
jgi:hypothetical protein